MTGMALVPPLGGIFWDLRGCWATGRRVALSVDADVSRLEGHVTRVSATDAFVCVGDVLVPGDRIMAVHLPSRLGDSSFTDQPGATWAGRPRRPEQYPGQAELPLEGR
jgi:hypothetical protein